MGLTQAVQDTLAAALGRDVAKGLGGPLLTITGDGACPIDQDRIVQLTKGSAAAITVAAPGAANIGRRITITTATNFAHVVTFTGSLLADGTTGLNITWTATAFAGCSITFVALSATLWAVESFNLGAIA